MSTKLFLSKNLKLFVYAIYYLTCIFNNFLRGLINGKILVDFDARTGHNHGTKFRIKQNNWEVLFSKITELK